MTGSIIRYAGYPAQLFNLAEDPNELQDIADHNPDMVKQLDLILTSQLDPDLVDKAAKKFDKDTFVTWKNILGDKYNSTIGSKVIRWYPTWHTNPNYYLGLIDKWLQDPDN